MTIQGSQQNITPDNVAFGNVYIMTHSIFSGVIKIGCTTSDSEEYTKLLSAKSPGHFELYFSVPCDNPCQIKKQLREHFHAKQYVNEFYEVSPETAKNEIGRAVQQECRDR